MISWIQSSLKHHFKTVIFLLIAVMIIPLVFVYSTSGGFGQADREIRERKIFGRNYTTEQDRREFALDGQISLQLVSGQPYFSPEQTEAYAFFRAAKLSLADQLGIPAPTDKQLEAFIRELPAFAGEDGLYDPQAYARFLDNTRNNPIYSQSRIARLLAEDWRGDQVAQAIGGPGYTLDPEIRDQIAAADTSWTVHRATVALGDIKPAGEPTETELQQWFEINAARYRNPPSVQVSVVDFPADPYLARLGQPTDDEIVRFFESRKSTYATPAAAAKEGEAPVVPTEPKLEDVRDRVVMDLNRQRAVTAATKAASDFAYVLFDKQITRGTPAFDTLVASFGTSIKPLQPLPITPQAAANPFLREAMTLSEDKPVSDPIVSGPGAVVLFFDGRADASDAHFALVRERVLADVQEDRRRRAVVARGEEIRAQLAAAVQAGTPFPAAAQAAGLEVKSWENFTRRTLPEDFDRSLMARMTDMPVGEVSPMAALGEQGTFLLVAQRNEPVVTSDDPSYAETRRAIMGETGRIAAQITLTNMVRAERLAAGIDRPDDEASR